MLRRRSIVFLAIALATACASRGSVTARVVQPSGQERVTDTARYNDTRARLIEQDRATRLGAGLVLSAAEEAANRRLAALKQQELDRTRGYFPTRT